MNTDITELLRSWKFDPETNVRRITNVDGEAVIQVRVDQGAFQGILQVHLDGRPDGMKPYGGDFVLDHYKSLRNAHQLRQGSDATFRLDADDCRELFDESSRVYGRYIFLLQLKEYDRVIRDTEHNMEIFRFVHRYAEREEDRNNLEKWWPYILRIHAVAQANKAAEAQDYDRALEVVRRARQRIVGLDQVEAEEFQVEMDRSLQALDELAEELMQQRPPSRREVLQRRLADAIEREEFERAAVLRDQLKALTAEDGAGTGVRDPSYYRSSRGSGQGGNGEGYPGPAGNGHEEPSGPEAAEDEP